MKLAAKELRITTPTPKQLAAIKRRPIFIIVENVLDTYNVGAIFRLADAARVAKVLLVGDSATPTDPKVGHKIHKASVGVWQWVPWEYARTTKAALETINRSLPISKSFHLKFQIPNSKFQNQNIKPLTVYAIEQDVSSIPYTEADYSYPLVLIVGHETTGISKETLKLADHIVEIPMYGVNKSMNVMVCLAIVLWEVLKTTEN